MSIKSATITVTCSGTAGGSTGTAVTPVIDGFPLAFYVDYGSAPASTDVTIAEAQQSPGLTILTVTDANTDSWFYRGSFADSDVLPVSDQLRVSVAGANDGDEINVTIRWLDTN